MTHQIVRRFKGRSTRENLAIFSSGRPPTPVTLFLCASPHEPDLQELQENAERFVETIIDEQNIIDLENFAVTTSPLFDTELVRAAFQRRGFNTEFATEPRRLVVTRLPMSH